MRCVIHIGTEKTGTTLIQEWLYSNRNKLEEAGISLSDVAGRPNNRKIPAYFQNHFDDFFRKRNISNIKQKEVYFAQFLDDLKQEINFYSKKSQIFLITSEHFHSRLIDINSIYSLKSYLDQFFKQYKIICYFREQSSVRTSLYSTALRGGFSGKISEFQREVKGDSHYYNYYNMLSKWEKVFGLKSISANIFDKSVMLDQDLRKDFIKNVSSFIQIDKLDYSVSSSNEKLSPILSYIYRAVNDVLPKSMDDDKRNKIRHDILKKMGKFENFNIGNIYDDDSYRFSSLFVNSNKELFLRYFDNKVSFPSIENGPFMQDTIDIKMLEEVIVTIVKETIKTTMNIDTIQTNI